MEINMDKANKTFNDFCNLMDQNIKGVKIGCYSVALIGFTIALRRVRPFSKFKRPSDVPNRFIKERRELLGTVERVEPTGALLMINHKPLVPFPIRHTELLPVKITGVNVTGHGISWLQTIVAGHEIRFIPILKDKTNLQCEIHLDQLTRDKKVRTINVAESLIAIGFGTLTNIEKPLFPSSEYKKYYSLLRAAEKYALKQKLGIKYYIKPTKEVLYKLYNKLNNVIGSKYLPAARRLAV